MILRFIIVCFSILAPMLVFAELKTTERVFNVEQSVFYSLRNRKDVLLVAKDVEMAKERIKEAESFNYPKIDLTFNYAKLNTDRFMVLPPAFGSILLPRNTPGDYYTTRFSLWQNVYAGGLYSSNIHFARSNLIRAESQEKVVTNDVVFEVKKSFYNLLASKQAAGVYEAVISSAESLSKNIKPKSIDEEMQASKIMSEINAEYSALKNRIEKQKMDYLDTLGLELDTDFRIEGSLEMVARDYDINKLLAWAFQYRPEPKQVQVQEEIDALSVKLSLSSRYPTVALGAHYEFPGETLAFDNKNWNATISVNLPIYDGWASWSKIRQKRMQVEQNKLRKKELEDSIRLEVRKAYFDYNYWTKEANVKKEQLQKAEEFLQRLPGSTVEGIKIYRFYVSTRVEHINTVLEHLKAMSAVEHAVGKSLVQE